MASYPPSGLHLHIARIRVQLQQKCLSPRLACVSPDLGLLVNIPESGKVRGIIAGKRQSCISSCPLLAPSYTRSLLELIRHGASIFIPIHPHRVLSALVYSVVVVAAQSNAFPFFWERSHSSCVRTGPSTLTSENPGSALLYARRQGSVFIGGTLDERRCRTPALTRPPTECNTVATVPTEKYANKRHHAPSWLSRHQSSPS